MCNFKSNYRFVRIHSNQGDVIIDYRSGLSGLDSEPKFGHTNDDSGVRFIILRHPFVWRQIECEILDESGRDQEEGISRERLAGAHAFAGTERQRSVEFQREIAVLVEKSLGLKCFGVLEDGFVVVARVQR